MTEPVTLREMLDVIDRFLARKGEEAARLALVLSALRGPDTDNFSLKEKTTAVIRATAFPLLFKGADHLECSVGRFSALGLMREDDQIVFPPNGTDRHFGIHTAEAAKALGLQVME